MTKRINYNNTGEILRPRLKGQRTQQQPATTIACRSVLGGSALGRSGRVGSGGGGGRRGLASSSWSTAYFASATFGSSTTRRLGGGFAGRLSGSCSVASDGSEGGAGLAAAAAAVAVLLLLGCAGFTRVSGCGWGGGGGGSGRGCRGTTTTTRTATAAGASGRGFAVGGWGLGFGVLSLARLTGGTVGTGSARFKRKRLSDLRSGDSGVVANVLLVDAFAALRQRHDDRRRLFALGVFVFVGDREDIDHHLNAGDAVAHYFSALNSTRDSAAEATNDNYVMGFEGGKGALDDCAERLRGGDANFVGGGFSCCCHT